MPLVLVCVVPSFTILIHLSLVGSNLRIWSRSRSWHRLEWHAYWLHCGKSSPQPCKLDPQHAPSRTYSLLQGSATGYGAVGRYGLPPWTLTHLDEWGCSNGGGAQAALLYTAQAPKLAGGILQVHGSADCWCQMQLGQGVWWFF